VRGSPTVRPMTTENAFYAFIGLARFLLTGALLVIAGHIIYDPPPGVTLWTAALGVLAASLIYLLTRGSFFRDLLLAFPLLAFVLWGPETLVHNLVYGFALIVVASTAWQLLTPRTGTDEPEPAPGYDPNRRMIGLWGYGGSGKDTAAEGLVFDGWSRVAVSDKILELALRLPVFIGYAAETPGAQIGNGRHTAYAPLGDLVDYLGYTTAKDIPEVREFLQELGVAVRDLIDPDAWVKATMNDLPEGDIVFTSTRFPNEAQAIVDAHGKIIRVTRPGVTAVNGHITETALEDWDFDADLINDGTPTEAREQLRTLVRTLF
jgi:hypothetical protein